MSNNIVKDSHLHFLSTAGHKQQALVEWVQSRLTKLSTRAINGQELANIVDLCKATGVFPNMLMWKFGDQAQHLNGDKEDTSKVFRAMWLAMTGRQPHPAAERVELKADLWLPLSVISEEVENLSLHQQNAMRLEAALSTPAPKTAVPKQSEEVTLTGQGTLNAWQVEEIGPGDRARVRSGNEGDGPEKKTGKHRRKTDEVVQAGPTTLKAAEIAVQMAGKSQLTLTISNEQRRLGVNFDQLKAELKAHGFDATRKWSNGTGYQITVSVPQADREENPLSVLEQGVTELKALPGMSEEKPDLRAWLQQAGQELASTESYAEFERTAEGLVIGDFDPSGNVGGYIAKIARSNGLEGHVQMGVQFTNNGDGTGNIAVKKLLNSRKSKSRKASKPATQTERQSVNLTQVMIDDVLSMVTELDSEKPNGVLENGYDSDHKTYQVDHADAFFQLINTLNRAARREEIQHECYAVAIRDGKPCNGRTAVDRSMLTLKFFYAGNNPSERARQWKKAQWNQAQADKTAEPELAKAS